MGRDEVLRRRPAGMTIGNLMLVCAAVAVVAWLFRWNTLESRWEQGLVIAVFGMILARIFVLLLHGHQCPACGKNTLGRVKAVSFGDHFLRCSSCGLKAKRYWLGRLWDASGTADDRYFEPSVKPISTWADGPIVPSSKTPETRTVGNLLRGKLHRQEFKPESVEIATGQSGWTGQSEEFSMSPSRPAAQSAPAGVKHQVADRFYRTLDAIRWARKSRP